jgi:hypothetical protein
MKYGLDRLYCCISHLEELKLIYEVWEYISKIQQKNPRTRIMKAEHKIMQKINKLHRHKDHT